MAVIFYGNNLVLVTVFVSICFMKLTWFFFPTVKPNIATDDEVTPLVTAAAAGSSEIVELLLKVS
jgi:hypothetical protein